MDTVVTVPLRDILSSDYQPFSGENYSDILLFRIVPVNPHRRASNDHEHKWSLQACSLFLQGWGLIDLPLRATFSPTHPLARRDVPLARARAFCFLLCTITPSRPRESPDCPSLRASDEHRFIVRVLRARRMVWRLPSHPSETARCASTRGLTGPSPPAGGLFQHPARFA